MDHAKCLWQCALDVSKQCSSVSARITRIESIKSSAVTQSMSLDERELEILLMMERTACLACPAAPSVFVLLIMTPLGIKDEYIYYSISTIINQVML